MRKLYSLILYLSVPLIILRLALRGFRNRAYWRRWSERFVLNPGQLAFEGVVWIHAVSVGEVQAAIPLIKILRQRYPGKQFVVTTMTPTGADRVREVFGNELFHVYLPYDFPGAVQRFLKTVRPCVALIMETEIWPNLFHYSHQTGLPIIIINARLSERSARGYRRFRRLARQTLANVTMIAAQGQADADRLVEIGADASGIKVTGSIKFDISIPASDRESATALRRELGQDRPVWVAASTHDGEDEVVLDALNQVRRRYPDSLLILVPRHPERFEKVATLCRQRGLAIARRSAGEICHPDTNVYLGDSMGELLLFYGAADVAFVGGSLVPTGGHNVLEPAALERPIIIGPHTFNFEDISQMMVEAGAAWRVTDAGQLADTVIKIFADQALRLETGKQGLRVVEENRGALESVLALIDAYIK